MLACALTDCGRMREMNEDTICCLTTPIGNLPDLYMVTDGMGGHKAGKFASEYARDCFLDAVREDEGSNPITIMNRAIQRANQELFEKASAIPELEGMGTTMVAACVDGDILYVSNAGDSRLYLVGDGIQQITRDHSLVEELVRQGRLERGCESYWEQKNIITKALGIGPQLTADFFEVELVKGDRILICSDGLSNMVPDEELERIVRTEENFTALPERLIAEANARGGRDNISVVMIEPELS